MVTSFIFGISMGIILHRLIMIFVLNEAPDSLCAYCKWLTQKTAWLSRKQTPAKLDRNRWKGCLYCSSNFGVDYPIKPCGNGDLGVRANYVHGGTPGIILFVDRHTAIGYFDINYCPVCGRPLTEEAWTEMERRIGGNDGTTDQ